MDGDLVLENVRSPRATNRRLLQSRLVALDAMILQSTECKLRGLLEPDPTKQGLIKSERYNGFKKLAYFNGFPSSSYEG